MTTVRRFDWRDTAAVLDDFVDTHGARLDADASAFLSADRALRFEPPLVQAIPDGIRSPESYLLEIGETLGTVCVVLLRAGAFALGLWDDDELIAHKAKKRYVTRGKGRAQATHLKTRGKSRYGSRLRLQNALAQLSDLSTRLHDLEEAHGRPRQCWLACPTRLVADFYDAKPAPPWRREEWRRIPYHVHEPDFEELRRVRNRLVTGQIAGQSVS